jgi:nitroreductase
MKPRRQPVDTIETMLTRRSVRVYDPRPIEESVLHTVLDVTRHAPSGSNREPTRLVVVKDGRRREALSEYCANQKFISQAPVVIAVVGKTIAYNRGGYMGENSTLVDGSIVLDHLTLVARSLGLGTCWIGAFDNAKVKAYLEIPEGWNVVGLTPLGYPADPGVFKETDRRMSLEQFVMAEKWSIP